MSTTGTNYTTKWVLSNGTLTISPTSGSSGIVRDDEFITRGRITSIFGLTENERNSVTKIVFSGRITIQYKDIWDGYIPLDSFSNLFNTGDPENQFLSRWAFPNLTSVDVSGLNASDVVIFSEMFGSPLEDNNITEIIGLDVLDVSNGKEFTSMFRGTKLASINLASFPLNTAKSIDAMLFDMDYCEQVTLPTNFSRTCSSSIDGTEYTNFGLAYSKMPATKNGVTITSDKDFFKLDSAQGGTWTRDVSGTATLLFKVTSTTRDANVATINYSYATTTATANLYIKKTSESSYPSTETDTLTLNGTGNSSVDITLPTDDAYDVKFVVSDGTTTIYSYPSVGSNILLLSVDETGNIMAKGMAGMVQMFAGATPPSGWLLCNGQAVSRTTYAELFAVIGTTYGTGDGSTTFNVPDFRNRMPIGTGDLYSLNSYGGNKDAIIPYHNHGFTNPTVDGTGSATITGGSHAHDVYYRSDNTTGGKADRLGVSSTHTGTRADAAVATTHTHSLPAHTHTLTGGEVKYAGTSGNRVNANLPPYRGIHFIIATGKIL